MFNEVFLKYAVFWLTLFWLFCFCGWAFTTPTKGASGYGIMACSYLAAMIMSVAMFYFNF